MEKKVLIASESAFRRNMLSEMLGSHKDLQIVGFVRNAKEAIEHIGNENLDILILDIEIENVDWFSQFYPVINNLSTKTIILLDKTPNDLNSPKLQNLIESNEYVVKPEGIWKDELPKIKEIILSKILSNERTKKQKLGSKARQFNTNFLLEQSRKLAENSNKKIKSLNKSRSEEYFFELSPVTLTKLETKIIVIGASVGGPRTLRTIFSEIPNGFPAPILVVQHLNHLFMRQFVTSLRSICKLKVKIGLNYEDIQPGIIYFSPGDKHMQVTIKNNIPCIRTFEGEPVNFCRPSVDVLFYSTARVYKSKTLGILLTGMGRDGVNGLQAIKAEGGKTVAESKETSILYGMPKVAAETGAADLILPNYNIVDEMIKFVS
ncbi:MAG: chemotaxis protein CheB [Promethearchaeota archaeon]